ncbi:acyltransferase [bacterium]|nr:acyltransferase [bacterium]MBU1884203.1 acyltransferase [bacterium]
MDKYKIPYVKTFEYTKIIGLENIEFGKNIIIDDFVIIYAKEKMHIGSFVHIASFSSISGGGELVMEDFSGLASGCRIVTGSDDFKEWGFGNPTIAEQFRNLKTGSVKIGKFAIIGTNSVILPNVVIGEGVSVAANSVVTKNLEPWGIYVGNKKVGSRDKEAVLKNYENFLATSENERVGKLFL